MMLRPNCKRQLRRGAATAELAVLLPFLAFLFVVGSDWCRIFYTSMTIQNAARNAAYYASEYPGVTDKMVYGYANVYDAAADDIEIPLGLTGMNLYYGQTSNNSYGTSIPSTGMAVPDSQDSYGTNCKIITVTYPFSMVSKFPIDVVGVPTSVTLQRTTYMRTAPVIPN
jgi:Flp pilus assembly protein TadG